MLLSVTFLGNPDTPTLSNSQAQTWPGSWQAHPALLWGPTALQLSDFTHPSRHAQLSSEATRPGKPDTAFYHSMIRTAAQRGSQHWGAHHGPPGLVSRVPTPLLKPLCAPETEVGAVSTPAACH